jgi:hypothetical protein
MAGVQEWGNAQIAYSKQQKRSSRCIRINGFAPRSDSPAAVSKASRLILFWPCPEGATGLNPGFNPGLNGTKISGIWDTSSPQRGREDSARGFNPGNPVPRRRALKGRQMERAKGRRHAKRGSISCPFGAALSGCMSGAKHIRTPRLHSGCDTLSVNPDA